MDHLLSGVYFSEEKYTKDTNHNYDSGLVDVHHVPLWYMVRSLSHLYGGINNWNRLFGGFLFSLIPESNQVVLLIFLELLL